ncbi:DUF4236 domain-containing protein [Devosia sp.]|uniref:DUF4236 domain-containing protein n=1 Tax=Devosia sp. TaxID=1871048 RepID=UPI0037BFFB91
MEPDACTEIRTQQSCEAVQVPWGDDLPFYIRKSVSFGPVRVNFSMSGVGVSAGVRGLRFGSGPRGH